MGQPIVVITGFSGAGKSTAMRCFDDAGFSCVDNLPARMLNDLARVMGAEGQPVAVGCDARDGERLNELVGQIDQVAAAGPTPRVVFLEAEVQTLVNRYKETRRRHPRARDGQVLHGVLAERDLLQPLRARADLIIDTTDLTAKQLVDRLRSEVVDRADQPALTFASYGHKHGPMRDADLAFDVRFLPNPYYDPGLRPLTGLDERVAAYANQDGETDDFLEDHLLPMLDYLLPRYAQEGKRHLVVGLGCTGGRHRSVAVAERLAAHYHDRCGWTVSVRHRDIGRDNHQYVDAAGH